MRRPSALIAVIGLLIAHPVRAVETPKPGSADPRIKTIDYDASEVVRIVGAFRTATQILLGEDETIVHVALGDATGWDVAPEKNILFVKPKAPRAPTNLIVTATTGTGQSRHYTFELSTRAGPTSRNSPNTFFVVRFQYPDQQRQHAATALTLTLEQQALEARLLQLKLDRGVVAGPRNLAYALQGSTAIAPSEVTDNGRFTVLRFPGAQSLPTVYAVTPDGSESLIPYDVRGEFVVIHLTAPQFRLRRGREVLCIFNQAYSPHGVNLGTGTAAGDVDRTLKEAKP